MPASSVDYSRLAVHYETGLPLCVYGVRLSRQPGGLGLQPLGVRVDHCSVCFKREAWPCAAREVTGGQARARARFGIPEARTGRTHCAGRFPALPFKTA